MKTFQQFQQEAYSQPERQSHKPKPPVDRKLKIDYGSGDRKKKYNMPTNHGPYESPKTLDV